MSTASNPNPGPMARHSLVRRRTADRLAARVHAALSAGRSSWPTGMYLNYLRASFDVEQFERILDQAAPIAESGDRALVRVSRTPRGHLCVIRLHGPDWSLILTHGRPLPGLILLVTDAPVTGQPHVWRLAADRFEKRVTAMNLAILAAVDPPGPIS